MRTACRARVAFSLHVAPALLVDRRVGITTRRVGNENAIALGVIDIADIQHGVLCYPLLLDTSRR
jgi:hypothetical protein